MCDSRNPNPFDQATPIVQTQTEVIQTSMPSAKTWMNLGEIALYGLEWSNTSIKVLKKEFVTLRNFFTWSTFMKRKLEIKTFLNYLTEVNSCVDDQNYFKCIVDEIVVHGWDLDLMILIISILLRYESTC